MNNYRDIIYFYMCPMLSTMWLKDTCYCIAFLLRHLTSLPLSLPPTPVPPYISPILSLALTLSLTLLQYLPLFPSPSPSPSLYSFTHLMWHSIYHQLWFITPHNTWCKLLFTEEVFEVFIWGVYPRCGLVKQPTETPQLSITIQTPGIWFVKSTLPGDNIDCAHQLFSQVTTILFFSPSLYKYIMDIRPPALCVSPYAGNQM